MTASLPTIARLASVVGWVVIVTVILRIVSGGGSVAGIGYVLSTEPRIAIYAGAIVLASAVVMTGALLLRRTWAWRSSRIGAAAALVGCLVLVVDGHPSALVAGAAAATILAIGVVMTRRAEG